MGFLFRFRLRASAIKLLSLGVVLFSVISYSSAGTSSRNVRVTFSRPAIDGLRDYYSSYNEDREDRHYDNLRLLNRRSSPPPPTSDDDFQNDFVEKRRGALDPHGRSIIFKSLILAPLALVVLILLAVLLIPIPVISNPIGVGRSIQDSSMHTLKMAREVLTSEECVERVSCELSRISRTYESTKWIPQTLEKLLVKAKWSDRIIRGINGIAPSACSQFTCRPAKHLKQALQSAAAVTQ